MILGSLLMQIVGCLRVGYASLEGIVTLQIIPSK